MSARQIMDKDTFSIVNEYLMPSKSTVEKNKKYCMKHLQCLRYHADVHFGDDVPEVRPLCDEFITYAMKHTIKQFTKCGECRKYVTYLDGFGQKCQSCEEDKEIWHSLNRLIVDLEKCSLFLPEDSDSDSSSDSDSDSDSD